MLKKISSSLLLIVVLSCLFMLLDYYLNPTFKGTSHCFLFCLFAISTLILFTTKVVVPKGVIVVVLASTIIKFVFVLIYFLFVTEELRTQQQILIFFGLYFIHLASYSFIILKKVLPT